MYKTKIMETGKTCVKYFLLSLAAICLAGAIFSSCAGGKSAARGSSSSEPPWFKNLEANYPDAKYLAAIGSGSSRDLAQKSAASSLAQIFSVHITSDIVSEEKYAQITGGGSTSASAATTINRTIGTSADEKLLNLRYSDYYTDRKGTVHVVAYLERIPTADIYRSQIKKDSETAEELFKRAGTTQGALKKYAFYDAAYTVAHNAENLLSQLKIIYQPYAAIAANSIVDIKKITNAIDSASKNITYRIVYDESGAASPIKTDKDKIISIVKNVMSNEGFFYAPDGNMTVTCKFGMVPVNVNPKYISVQWSFTASFLDETKTEVAVFSKETRENSLSDAQVQTLAYREAEKHFSAEFPKNIQSYLTKVVVK
jgi:hypothetical protein